MAQKLFVPITFQIYQNGALVRAETVTQDVIKVGRDQKSHLRIEDDLVARMHAVIEVKPDDVQIIDLGSGTQVNGQPISRCSLRTGDTFQLGGTRVAVEFGAARSLPTTAAPETPAGSFAPPAVPAMDGDEIYQLIKRAEINPNEFEVVGGHAVEVSVLWKSSILHVAHLDGSKSFALTAHDSKPVPASRVLAGSLAVGGALMVAGAAMSDPQHLERSGSLVVGGLGAFTSLMGTGVAARFHHRNEDSITDTGRFVVGPELLGGAMDLPVVINDGGTRFVFLPGATGEVELQGIKRSLEDLKSQGHARPSSTVPGGFEVNIQPEGRYRQEIGGLTLVAKVVAPGRVVAGHIRHEKALTGALAGAGVFMAAVMATMHFAATDTSGFISSASDDDRLAELRAFVQRQQEREPEVQAQAEVAQEAAAGARHEGAEGKAGRREAPVRSARLAIQRRQETPQLSRTQARDAVRDRGIFAAIGAPGGGAAGGSSGMVNPFGGMTESGPDAQSAAGNMNGDTINDAFGYGALGSGGTGYGGGGHGDGVVGAGDYGTRGHSDGDGNYGASAGRHLRARGTSGPPVRGEPPVVSGLLSSEAIRRVVLRNLGQVNHCHEQGLATNPNAEGRITVRFVIGGTGNVMGSGVVSSTYPIQSVADCVANAARRWQFPAPDGGGVVTVNYPFNLRAPDQ